MEEQVETVQKIVNTMVEFGIGYGFQVFGAVIILIIGFIIGGFVAKSYVKFALKKGWDVTLSGFVGTVLKFLIITFALIAAMGKFGITIAPFIAALGALAFGASFAIQGPLSNYGAGLSIILSRPFVVGNTINVAGVNGVVKEVKLACTILTNEDGVDITIPNKHIVGEILHNSKENTIVEGVIGVTYASDLDKAIETISGVLAKFSEVNQDPKPQIGVQEFAASSINIGFRYWLPTVKYFQLSYAINLEIYKALQAVNIEIPFPQQDVRIVSQEPVVKA